MLSDCVISWLNMHVLTLTLENFISIKFSQFFWCLSVERPDGPSWRPNGWSSIVRTVPFLKSEWMAFCRPDGIRSTSGRELSSSGRHIILFVRTCITILLLSKAARVWTSSNHRPDGHPTEAINSPDHRSHSSIPHKIPSFDTLWVISWVFGVFSTCLLVHSHSRYFFFLVSFFFSSFISNC
jgi:hypothetical protein